MWQNFQHERIEASDSPSETARFGIPVARVSVGIDAPLAEDSFAIELQRVIAGMEADVIVVRYPAEAIWLSPHVQRTGYRTLPAGALTYWEIAAAQLSEAAATTGDLSELQPTSEALQPVVTSIVADSFDGYANHYAANPKFSTEHAREGYLEWAQTSASKREDIVVLGYRGEPIGVATLAVSDDGADLEVLLAGLVASSQGKGWYGALLSAVGRKARSRGCARVLISTQVHNTRVQRAWVNAGLKPFAAIETVHLLRF